MSLTLELAPDVEQALRAEADRTGRKPEDLAAELIRDRYRVLPQRAKLSPEEWIREATAWIDSHREWPVLPDSAYDRESFYGERG